MRLAILRHFFRAMTGYSLGWLTFCYHIRRKGCGCCHRSFLLGMIYCVANNEQWQAETVFHPETECKPNRDYSG